MSPKKQEITTNISQNNLTTNIGGIQSSISTYSLSSESKKKEVKTEFIGGQGPQGISYTPKSFSVVRDENGFVSQLIFEEKTVNITRTNGFITGKEDGEYTWIYERENKRISNVEVGS